MTVMLYRGLGHPWTAEPDWDQLLLGADSVSELDPMVADAESKFWKVWYRTRSVGTEQCRAHMFKPSGQQSEWQDIRWEGTPRGHGHQFKVGDEVYTEIGTRGGFLSRPRHISLHKIVEIAQRPVSQTGIVLRVTPAPRGTVYVDDNGHLAKGLPWIDSAWFRKVA